MKRLIAVLISLTLLPPVIWLGFDTLHPKARVGVVLVDDCPAWAADTAIEGFGHYADYFDGRLLPEIFNSSGVKRERNLTLNSDYFKLGNPGELKQRYGVDIILFITKNAICNWDEDGGGVWGQADLETGAALMTISPFRTDSTVNRTYIRNVALHEVLHLLGYPHNGMDGSDIMQYGADPRAMSLSPLYELQLPVRVTLCGLWFGINFKLVVLLANVIFSLLILPWFAVAGTAIHVIYGQTKNSRRPTKLLLALCIIISFFIISVNSGAFWVLGLPLLFMLFSYQIWYTYYRFAGKGLQPRKD